MQAVARRLSNKKTPALAVHFALADTHPGCCIVGKSVNAQKFTTVAGQVHPGHIGRHAGHGECGLLEQIGRFHQPPSTQQR